MQVSKETRTVSLSAPDLASIAGLQDPSQFKFADGSDQDVVATIVRDA